MELEKIIIEGDNASIQLDLLPWFPERFPKGTYITYFLKFNKGKYRSNESYCIFKDKKEQLGEGIPEDAFKVAKLILDERAEYDPRIIPAFDDIYVFDFWDSRYWWA